MRIKDVIENGGATVDARGDVPLHDGGYYISAEYGEKSFPLWIIDKDLFVEDFISRLFPHDENYQYPDEYRYIGFWVHDDKLYCDKSCHIDNHSRALSKALDNHQLAFWDIANNCEIVIDRDIRPTNPLFPC